MPPTALISSQASVSPFLNSTPSAAAKSVRGAAWPTGIGSPAALAPSLSAASMAVEPAATAAVLPKKWRRDGLRRLDSVSWSVSVFLVMGFNSSLTVPDFPRRFLRLDSSPLLDSRQCQRGLVDGALLMRLQILPAPTLHDPEPRILDPRARAGELLHHGEPAIGHVGRGVAAFVREYQSAAADLVRDFHQHPRQF